MKTLLTLLCGVMLAIVLAANAGALQIDLIKNGGFETGDWSNWEVIAPSLPQRSC